MGRKITKNVAVIRSRSLGPEYVTSEPDYESEFLEQKIKEGKYGLDLYHGEGGDKETALAWYLPRISEKLRHVERKLKKDAATKESLALVPLPPAVQEAKKDLALTPASTREVGKRPQYPYVRPSQNSLVDLFHPTLGPYFGRIWSLPDYLNPISGRDRSLSEPLHVTSGWTDWKSYEKPFSSYSINTLIKPDYTEVTELRKQVIPARTFYTYTPSVDTKLAVEKANRSMRMAVDYDLPPLQKFELPARKQVEVAEKPPVPSYTYFVIPHDVTSSTYYLNCSCWGPL